MIAQGLITTVLVSIIFMGGSLLSTHPVVSYILAGLAAIGFGLKDAINELPRHGTLQSTPGGLTLRQLIRETATLDEATPIYIDRPYLQSAGWFRAWTPKGSVIVIERGNE